MIMKIKVDPGAYYPVRAHETDAGLDLRSPINTVISPHRKAVIDTGIHVAIPEGYVGLLTSKSGLMAKHGITSRGTIDSGYTGSIRVVLFNHSEDYFAVCEGDKISQLVILPMLVPTLEYVSDLDETERGEGGFGSSGR